MENEKVTMSVPVPFPRLSDIAQTLRNLSRQSRRPTTLIGISGFGGSGKSTLARQLAGLLRSAEVVSADDFITNRLCHRSDDWSDFDRDRLLREVLIPARSGRPIAYGLYSWSKNTIEGRRQLAATPFLIIEGCSIFHPDLRPSYHCTIWIDLPLPIALQRGLARDQAGGASATHVALWRDLWMPNDEGFYNKYHPHDNVTFLYASQCPSKSSHDR